MCRAILGLGYRLRVEVSMACHDPRRQGMKQGITVCSMAQHGTDSRQMGKNCIIALAALRRESCGILHSEACARFSASTFSYAALI